MKMTEQQSKDLIAVLNAQAGVKGAGFSKKTLSEEAYKKALTVYNGRMARVKQFLAVDAAGKATGGLKHDVWKDNKDNKALMDAADNHKNKGKAKAEKAVAAPAAKKAAKKVATPTVKGAITPRPEAEEKAAAASIVKFLNAKTEFLKTGKTSLPIDEYKSLTAKVKTYVDAEKGGLKNDKPTKEGAKSPWDRFKGYDGVEPACKENKAAVKAKAKDAPAIG